MGDKNIRLLDSSDIYSTTGLASLCCGISELYRAENVSVDTSHG